MVRVYYYCPTSDSGGVGGIVGQLPQIDASLRICCNG